MHKHTISFMNAGRGIWTATSTQLNIRIHLIIASLVLFAAVYFNLSIDNVVHLVMMISLVIVTEMFNTALEFLSDAVTRDMNPYIKMAKDVSAGAVLLSAIFAALVGLFIFLPVIL